jgi:hypothetical protein
MACPTWWSSRGQQGLVTQQNWNNNNNNNNNNNDGLWVGTAQSVQWWTMDWMTGVRSPTEADFSSSLCVQTGSGAHPASCPMGVLSPGVKRGRSAMLTTPQHLVPRLSMSKNYTSCDPHVPPRRVVGSLYFVYRLCGSPSPHTNGYQGRSGENVMVPFNAEERLPPPPHTHTLRLHGVMLHKW